MRSVRIVAAAFLVVVCGSSAAWAQPTISSSSIAVTPGDTVTLTVTGTAGQNFAIIGSTVGSGFSYGGSALAVGPDVIIIAQGVIGGPGTVAIGFTPPFTGTALDRYYLQAVTSASPAFVPLTPSAGLILRNSDAIPPALMASNSASNAATTLVAGDNFVLTSPTFTTDRPMSCLVTSSVQIDPGAVAVPIGSNFAFVRNAVSRNGATSEDGVYGHYIVSNGLITRQPSLTRSSVIQVGAGESVRFGAYLGSVPAGGAGSTVRVQTSYFCQ